MVKYNKVTILEKLSEIKKNINKGNIKLGLAGSYVRGEETEDSDIDIVVDYDMLSIEDIDYISSCFDIDVDVVQLPILKKEDEEYHEYIKANNMMEDDYTYYTSIVSEVVWCE